MMDLSGDVSGIRSGDPARSQIRWISQIAAGKDRGQFRALFGPSDVLEGGTLDQCYESALSVGIALDIDRGRSDLAVTG
jgi:hypothetical protein